MDLAGRDPEHALRAANLKRAALAYVAAEARSKAPGVKNQSMLMRMTG